jgi:phosphate transport system protein
MTSSLRITFDREFEDTRQNLYRLAEMVDTAIDQSLKALVERDLKLAEDIIANDGEINKLRFKIEEECLALIATQQPAASDLREIIAIIHLVVEMERMGDYAAGIAKTTIMMSEEPLLKTTKKIPRMGEISREMLADSIKAFQEHNADWARDIAARDNEIDDLYQSLFHKLIKIMAKEPEMITRCTYLMWCAHNLERIADRVTNIAELIIFMTTGDMRELQG